MDRRKERSPKDVVEFALLVTKIGVLVLSYLKHRDWIRKRKRKSKTQEG